MMLICKETFPACLWSCTINVSQRLKSNSLS